MFDKVFDAVAKPPSAAMIVTALYNAIGEYHALRDEKASQLSIAVKMEALRLVNASLSNADDTTRLEIMLNIIAVAAGVMVGLPLVLLMTRPESVCNFCPQPFLVFSACRSSILEILRTLSFIMALLIHGCRVLDSNCTRGP
jgi:hypothetical protein